MNCHLAITRVKFAYIIDACVLRRKLNRRFHNKRKMRDTVTDACARACACACVRACVCACACACEVALAQWLRASNIFQQICYATSEWRAFESRWFCRSGFEFAKTQLLILNH